MFDKYEIGELRNLENDLFFKTSLLFDGLNTDDTTSIDLPEFRLSEIFSLKTSLDLFLKVKPDYQHYELTSLLTYWDNAFHEIKSVIKDNDDNVSWMNSEFNNYKDQHEIVDTMLLRIYEEMN